MVWALSNGSGETGRERKGQERWGKEGKRDSRTQVLASQTLIQSPVMNSEFQFYFSSLF